MAQRLTSEILTRWQKLVVRGLLFGFVVLAGSGLFLLRSDGASTTAAVALLAHILVGLVAIPLLLAFVIPHAKAQMLRRPVIGFTGALVTLTVLGVGLSGVLLAFERSSLRGDWVWPLHVIGGFGVLLLYVVHRRFGTNPASWHRLGAGVTAMALVGVLLLAVDQMMPVEEGAFARGEDAPLVSNKNYGLARSNTPDGEFLKDHTPITDMTGCARCHPRITAEWARSAHRHSSMTNPFYKGTIQAMRETYPLVDTKWCASCHDPALLFTGKMDDPDLDFESVEARAGLTCMSCHAIDVQSTLGNGDYVVGRRRAYAWEKYDDPALQEAHDVLLRAKPDAHIESLRPHNIQEPGFCSACHKAEVPPELNRRHWFRAQDEFDAHDDSGASLGNVRSFYHPPFAKRCQDCHMPLVADAEDPAADARGFVRSHLFPAANSALPHMRGDTDMIERQHAFLSTALRVDMTGIVLPRLEGGDARRRLFAPAPRILPAVKPGEIVEAHVVVRNVGVGHPFPGGTIDSNEVWVRFEAAVGDAEPFYVSGDIDEDTGIVDQSAEFYRAYPMDKHGKHVVNRIGPDVHTVVYKNVIGPGTADVVRYRFRVPEGATGDLRLEATLYYRKFMRQYIDFLFPDSKIIQHRPNDELIEVDVSKLPILDIGTARIALPVTAEGTPTYPPKPSAIDVVEDTERINDLGIAYYLDEQFDEAAYLFEEVTRMKPDYPDGWVNVARAYIGKRDWAPAWENLRKAAELKPGWAKVRFFEGVIYDAQKRFAESEQAFADVLIDFPRERAALRNLTNAQYEQDKFEDALKTVRRLFEIDPEDWRAWAKAQDVYRELEDLEAAEAANAAYRRFRPEDDEKIRAGNYQQADENLERMSEKIHVHAQKGLGGP